MDLNPAPAVAVLGADTGNWLASLLSAFLPLLVAFSARYSEESRKSTSRLVRTVSRHAVHLIVFGFSVALFFAIEPWLETHSAWVRVLEHLSMAGIVSSIAAALVDRHFRDQDLKKHMEEFERTLDRGLKDAPRAFVADLPAGLRALALSMRDAAIVRVAARMKVEIEPLREDENKVNVTVGTEYRVRNLRQSPAMHKQHYQLHVRRRNAQALEFDTRGGYRTDKCDERFVEHKRSHELDALQGEREVWIPYTPEALQIDQLPWFGFRYRQEMQTTDSIGVMSGDLCETYVVEVRAPKGLEVTPVFSSKAVVTTEHTPDAKIWRLDGGLPCNGLAAINWSPREED